MSPQYSSPTKGKPSWRHASTVWRTTSASTCDLGARLGAKLLGHDDLLQRRHRRRRALRQHHTLARSEPRGLDHHLAPARQTAHVRHGLRKVRERRARRGRDAVPHHKLVGESLAALETRRERRGTEAGDAGAARPRGRSPRAPPARRTRAPHAAHGTAPPPLPCCPHRPQRCAVCLAGASRHFPARPAPAPPDRSTPVRAHDRPPTTTSTTCLPTLLSLAISTSRRPPAYSPRVYY
jgi:hypothetical protein